jgi:hypothetical protein
VPLSESFGEVRRGVRIEVPSVIVIALNIYALTFQNEAPVSR